LQWSLATWLAKKSITSWKAIELYQATRLADIIFTLKQQGWNIITTMRYEPNGMRYAIYPLHQLPRGQKMKNKYQRNLFYKQHDEPTWASALGVVCLAIMFLVLAFI
jgi:hypothetical protein